MLLLGESRKPFLALHVPVVDVLVVQGCLPRLAMKHTPPTQFHQDCFLSLKLPIESYSKMKMFQVSRTLFIARTAVYIWLIKDGSLLLRVQVECTCPIFELQEVTIDL